MVITVIMPRRMAVFRCAKLRIIFELANNCEAFFAKMLFLVNFYEN